MTSFQEGFEWAWENGEKVRVALVLDCCDRDAICNVATTEGAKRSMIVRQKN